MKYTQTLLYLHLDAVAFDEIGMSQLFSAGCAASVKQKHLTSQFEITLWELNSHLRMQ